MAGEQRKTGYEGDLYICMHEAEEKRKNILIGIKTSLIMQGEAEKLSELRSKKKIVLDEIKETMNKINSKYLEIKKNLPNVKNIIPYTEKEIKELETQIYNLKETIKIDKSNVRTKKSIKGELERLEEDIKPKPSRKKVSARVRGEEPKKEEVVKKESKGPKMIPVKDDKPAKIDRIKNNLKFIESKLKHI